MICVERSCVLSSIVIGVSLALASASPRNHHATEAVTISRCNYVDAYWIDCSWTVPPANRHQYSLMYTKHFEFPPRVYRCEPTLQQQQWKQWKQQQHCRIAGATVGSCYNFSVAIACRDGAACDEVPAPTRKFCAWQDKTIVKMPPLLRNYSEPHPRLTWRPQNRPKSMLFHAYKFLSLTYMLLGCELGDQQSTAANTPQQDKWKVWYVGNATRLAPIQLVTGRGRRSYKFKVQVSSLDHPNPADPADWSDASNVVEIVAAGGAAQRYDSYPSTSTSSTLPRLSDESSAIALKVGHASASSRRLGLPLVLVAFVGALIFVYLLYRRNLVCWCRREGKIPKPALMISIHDLSRNPNRDNRTDDEIEKAEPLVSAPGRGGSDDEWRHADFADGSTRLLTSSRDDVTADFDDDDDGACKREEKIVVTTSRVTDYGEQKMRARAAVSGSSEVEIAIGVLREEAAAYVADCANPYVTCGDDDDEMTTTRKLCDWFARHDLHDHDHPDHDRHDYDHHDHDRHAHDQLRSADDLREDVAVFINVALFDSKGGGAARGGKRDSGCVPTAPSCDDDVRLRSSKHETSNDDGQGGDDVSGDQQRRDSDLTNDSSDSGYVADSR